LTAQHGNRVAADKVAKGIFRTSATWLGIASLALALGALPADAKDKKPKPAQDDPIADVDSKEPMTLVISTGQQKIDVYRGTTLITTSQVSTGTAAHPTFLGVFSIIEKQRWHHSNIYSGAPMPWMNRITWSGTAIHAGVVPGYPASHGCIRLLYSFAPQLYQMTTVGDRVVIARDRPTPKLIEHPALFQPLPPPPPPAITEKEKPREHSTELMRPRGLLGASPVILAKAEVIGDAVDDTATIAPTSTPDAHAVAETDHAPDTDHAIDAQDDADPKRIHAVVDPNAGGGHAIAPQPSEPSEAGDSRASAPVAAAAPTPAAGAAPAVAAETPAPAVETPAATPPAAAPVAVAAPMPEPKPASVPRSGPAIKLSAGAKAAAIVAAEPRSTAPLRILITRRTQRDRIIGVQNILSSLGYLERQNFDGTIGKQTITAIKAFQKANGMPETGAFTDELVKKVYAAANQGEPPSGHMFVRQELGHVFDLPINYKDPDKPLGTYQYTALNFAPGDTNVKWTAITLVNTGEDPLDRIEIPDDVRQKISERLTPGSTLIIADTAINSAGLPKGGDFVVFANYSAAAKTASAESSDSSADEAPAVKRKARRSARSYQTSPYYRPYRTYRSTPWSWGPFR
jgi:peptidoglycan hydrolase-like protein with peptidoglycan-binding domain